MDNLMILAMIEDLKKEISDCRYMLLEILQKVDCLNGYEEELDDD